MLILLFVSTLIGIAGLLAADAIMLGSQGVVAEAVVETKRDADRLLGRWHDIGRRVRDLIWWAVTLGVVGMVAYFLYYIW